MLRLLFTAKNCVRGYVTVSENCPSCQSVAAFSLAPSGKSAAHFRASLLPHEGRVATVTRRWQWDAMGVCRRSVNEFARTNGEARTVKSRGPDIPTLISTHAGASLRVGMVASKPAHQGEREAAVKTVAQGRPDDPARTCGSCRQHFLSLAGHGCDRHPAFPAPS
jgi:hypothetical protein